MTRNHRMLSWNLKYMLWNINFRYRLNTMLYMKWVYCSLQFTMNFHVNNPTNFRKEVNWRNEVSCWDSYLTRAIHTSCLLSKLSYMYYRGLKFVPLEFKRLLILQSANKVKLSLSSCFFSKPDSSKAKIFWKLVAFAIFQNQ